MFLPRLRETFRARVWTVTFALVVASIGAVVVTERASADGGFGETCRTVWIGGQLGCSNPCGAGCDDSCRNPTTGNDYDQYCKCSSGDCSEPACCHLVFRYSGGFYVGIFPEGTCGGPSCNGGSSTTCQLEQVVVPIDKPPRWAAACRL